MTKIYLASSSPRRRRLMKNIAADFEILSPGGAERDYPRLSPRQKAIRRAKDKCLMAESLVKGEDAAVISADTVVNLDGKALGKPRDKKRAFLMLSALCGKTHTVSTGVSVIYKGRMYSFCRNTKVKFSHIPLDRILEYISTEEPYDKAGGYAVQGAMGRYISGIDGEYYNIVGLPVKRLRKLLAFLKIV